MLEINVPLASVSRLDGTAVAHASPQTSVAFSPDGSSYASGGYDGRVVLWDRATRTARWTRGHGRLVNAVRFSPSGRLLASCGADKVCRIWRVADGTLVNLLSRQPDDLNALAWLDEHRLVTVSQDGTGRVWDVEGGRLEEVCFTHTDHCMSVDATADGAYVATCGEDATIRLWESSGTLLRILDRAGHAEMCRFSPDGALLAASCDDGYVHLMLPDGTPQGLVGPYDVAVKAIAWSPDAAFVAVGAYDSTVRIWDRVNGHQVASWQGPHLWPRSLDWSADGRTLVVGTTSGAPAVLDVPVLGVPVLDAAGSGAAAHMVRVDVPQPSLTAGVNHIAVRGAVLAAGGDDGHVSVWSGGDPLAAIPVGERSLVNSVAVGPQDHPLIAYGSFSGCIGVVDPADPDQDVAHAHVGQPVNRVTWSPAGDRLAVADYEGRLRIFSPEGDQLKELMAYEGHEGAVKDFCWIGDERIVTVSTDRSAHLITADGERIRSFTGHGELVNGVSVSRVGDRTVLATVSRDRTVRLHDLDSSHLLGVLAGHDESVKAVAFAPDGSPRLLSGSYDFTARLWTLDPVTWTAASVEVLVGHTNAISSVGWLEGEPVTAGWDGRILRWTADDDGDDSGSGVAGPGTGRHTPRELVRPPHAVAG